MRITTILMLAVLALAIMGCSTSTPQPQAPANDNTQTQTPQTTTTTNSNDDVTGEFEKLLSTKKTMEFKVDYNIKTTSDGKTMNSKMSQYIKGEDKIRADMTFNGMQTRTFIQGEQFTTCTMQDTEWNCYKFTQDKDAEDGPINDFEENFDENPDQFAVTRDGTMTVAGVSTKCYKMTTQGDDASVVKYCFSKEAVPLYVKMESDEYTAEMTATSYATKVPNTDFDLPAGAKVSEYNAAGGTMPEGSDACSACDYLTGDDRDECLASC